MTDRYALDQHKALFDLDPLFRWSKHARIAQPLSVRFNLFKRPQTN
jgi:hypothetical protein